MPHTEIHIDHEDDEDLRQKAAEALLWLMKGQIPVEIPEGVHVETRHGGGGGP